MDSVDVPRYFICPISLQIMKDPVTTITGITYDRDSIERWLFTTTTAAVTCPVTNQTLPLNSPLTPNHTLRRLIQSWCTLNSLNRIPTPRAPLDPPAALNLLSNPSLPTLHLISALAAHSETNRRCLLRAGAVQTLTALISSHKTLAPHALATLTSLRPAPDDLKPHVDTNSDLLHSLTSALLHHSIPTRSAAIQLLQTVSDLATPSLLGRLKLDFFQAVVLVIRDRISSSATKAALHVLLLACPAGRNRAKAVEAGAVRELIELELETAGAGADKRMTELALGVLDNLCTCADGRAELVGHAAGIALVSKRILRVSGVADERAVSILSSVCRYSATGEVLQEMLRVGAVSKLCFVMQADCGSGVREMARWVLRLHSGVWKTSPCIHGYLLTAYP